MLGCKDKSDVRTISWTGSTHTLADTIVFGNDTQVVNKQLYFGHQIIVSDTGCRLITREQYGAPRQFYRLTISDSIKEMMFNLILDSAILNIEQTMRREESEVAIYCGFNYLLSINKTRFRKDIKYLPPYANEKLKTLHDIFDSILDNATVTAQIELDTLTLDSLVFENVKGFNPNPPLRSTVKFQPPEIKKTTQ